MNKTTNWQIRLNKKEAELVKKKQSLKTDLLKNRSINGTITLIVQIYFGLKEETSKLINVVDVDDDRDIYQD